MGKVLEPVAIARFTSKTKLHGHATSSCKSSTRASVALGHARRRVRDEGVVEAKSVGWANPRDWGDELEDDAIPIGYSSKCSTRSTSRSDTHAWVPLIVLNREFRVYRVNRDDELIDARREGTPFWKHVETARRRRLSATKTRIRSVAEGQRQDDSRDRRSARRVTTLANAKARSQDAEFEKSECAKAKVAKFMGENQILVDAAGKPLVTWKTAKASMKVDVDRMRARTPIRRQTIRIRTTRQPPAARQVTAGESE
jgi:hypothetical protein